MIIFSIGLEWDQAKVEIAKFSFGANNGLASQRVVMSLNFHFYHFVFSSSGTPNIHKWVIYYYYYCFTMWNWEWICLLFIILRSFGTRESIR